MKCPNCGAGLPDRCGHCPPKKIQCYKCGTPVNIGGELRITDIRQVKVRR